MVEAKKMNTTLLTSLVALLSLIPILVMTGCSTPTPGVANPAGTTASTTTSAPSPSAPNSNGPNSTAVPPPAQSAPTTPTSDASPEESSSDEPSSQEPTSQDSSSQEPTGPAVLPTDLSGEVYGFIRAVDVDQSQLTLDKIDWFTGAAAEQACTDDAVPQEEHLNGWCSIYYFRNVNPKLRVVSVSPDAVITTLEGNSPVGSTLATLADEAATDLGLYHPYRSVVANGAIVELTEIYQP
jgi:hypothetical protein